MPGSFTGWPAFRQSHIASNELGCCKQSVVSVAEPCGGTSMHDWKSELDALVAETMAFANSLKVEIERPRPRPKVVDEQVGLSVPD